MRFPFRLLAAALLLSPLPAIAHHSYAMFDMTKTVALKGTVVKFKWQNPHAWIEIDVPVKGTVERWAIEATSPNNLANEGWTRSSLKAGDAVTIYAHPLRDGGKGGSLLGALTASGKLLGRDK